MITQTQLKKALHYDPATGLFTHKKAHRKVKIGDVAGTDHKGYVRISLGGKSYLAHRLAWLYEFGDFPEDVLDHKNGIKSDNRIENLRPTSMHMNCHNQSRRKKNISGYKGVSWSSVKKKWVAQISIDKSRVYLGQFDDVREAAEAYIFAALEHHGEFARFE